MGVLALSRRSEQIEILDQGSHDQAEMAGNLADMRFYNARCGGTAAAIAAVRRILTPPDASGKVSLLDVGTGSADIPAALSRWCARRGIEALARGVDAHAGVLAEARRSLPPGGPTVDLIQADARSLPCADRSVDLVTCCNFLHHLDASEALPALREMKRVARRGVVVVDLVRSLSGWAGVWLLTRLTTRNRLTLSDALLSVARAYTPGELRELAGQAGLAGAVVSRRGPARMVLTWIAGK